MAKRIDGILLSLILATMLPCLPMAEAQEPSTAKQDSAKVTAQVERAQKIAGAEWAAEAHFFCMANPAGTNPKDPVIEPAKIFDNAYAIGRSGTVVYALTTADGIILIDSGFADDLQSVLLTGMTKVGLDPANVKYLIITHGHADHFGGAAYLQEHYGTRVVMSAADWDFMLNPSAPARLTTPKRDIIAIEGQPITLGDEKVTPVFIPGHTPGSMALVFPVKDGSKTHMAGLFGGTILVPGRIPDAQLQQYLRSIAHYQELAKEMKVDVELQNHPTYDGREEKLAKLRDRKPGEPNPFIVGQSGYGKFLDVMSECMRAQIARRTE